MLTATVLDCQSLCGAIYQQKGSLLVKDSRLCRSARVPLVHFAGEYAEFQNTGLQNGLEGLLVFEDPAKVYIVDSSTVRETMEGQFTQKPSVVYESDSASLWNAMQNIWVQQYIFKITDVNRLYRDAK